MSITQKCKVDDCEGLGEYSKKLDKRFYKKGLCIKHYHRLKKYGDVHTIKHVLDGRKKYKEYSNYHQMLQRCTNSNDPYYHNYGGKGIFVCDRWLDKEQGFWNFIKDMGDKPSSKHSLDRIDNEKGYEPSNCRWATSTMQIINQRISCRNTSGYKGVSWRNDTHKWNARLKFMGKNMNLGSYETIEEAIAVRKQYEDRYFKPLLSVGVKNV